MCEWAPFPDQFEFPASTVLTETKTEMAAAGAGGHNNFTEVAEEYPVTIVQKVKTKLGITFLTKEVSQA